MPRTEQITTERIVLSDSDIQSLQNGDVLAINYNDARVEIAAESDESDGYDIPEEGTIVTDLTPPKWSDDPRVEITEVTDDVAGDHFINTGNKMVSVAMYNGVENDVPVVKGEYIDGKSKEYAFPVTRLKW